MSAPKDPKKYKKWKKNLSRVAKEKGFGKWMKDRPGFFKGKKHSEQSKKKMSKTLKGRKVWNKGTPWAEETKKKISNTLKGRKLSNETINKLKGNHWSIKTELKKGHIPWNKEKKGLQTAWNQGKKFVHSGSFKVGHKINVGRKSSEETIKKISKANFGKIRTEETRRKQSAIKQGISLKDWKKFVSFEPYDKKFNNKFKRAIRKRDNYICMKCSKHQEKEGRSLSVHHINYNKKLTLFENCCTLCKRCNNEVNGNRKHWTKFFQSLLSEKYGYKYSENNEIILEIKNEN